MIFILTVRINGIEQIINIFYEKFKIVLKKSPLEAVLTKKLPCHLAMKISPAVQKWAGRRTLFS